MSAPTAPPTSTPPRPHGDPLSSATAIRLVARREFVERVRDRSFLISTLVTVLIVVGIVVGPQLFGGDPASYDVAVAGDGAEELAAGITATAEAAEIDVTVEPVGDDAALADLVADGTYHAAVTDGEIVVDEELPAELEGVVQQASRDVRLAGGLQDAGVPPEQVPELLGPPPLEVRTLAGADDGEEDGATAGLAFFATFILYGQVLGYGFMVAGGVVEEKATRVVEVLLSTLKPTQLLAGKIIGVGLVGLAQLVVLAGLAIGVVLVTGLVELPPGAPGTIAMVFLWFLLGYAFYACLFGVAGSLVSRQEELGNVTTPLMLVIIVGFFGAIGALQDPGSAIARILSFIPPTAPMVMPVRVAFGEATLVEVVGAVVATAGAAALLVPVAARIYTGAVLRTGARVKLGQAWRGGSGRG